MLLRATKLATGRRRGQSRASCRDRLSAEQAAYTYLCPKFDTQHPIGWHLRTHGPRLVLAATYLGLRRASLIVQRSNSTSLSLQDRAQQRIGEWADTSDDASVLKCSAIEAVHAGFASTPGRDLSHYVARVNAARQVRNHCNHSKWSAMRCRTISSHLMWPLSVMYLVSCRADNGPLVGCADKRSRA